MAKQLLIETRMNSLSLCEGVQSKHPGCLGTISGPCADFENPTRNNNFYSRQLWENVFKDPLVVESLEDRVLIGELDHPGDRLETKATNAAIVMTEYKFNDKDGVVEGTFDILDTPNGRILRSLLDYGCKIGVSSRGEGDVTSSNGVETVDPDSYYFVGFDAVVLPAVKKAKPTLQESLKREKLSESLTKQINNASTKSELDLIKKVIEATELPESDSLLESVDIKSQELEGITDSSNLIEDLERSTSEIQTLIKENKSLKQEVTNCKSTIKKMTESSKRAKIDESKQKEKQNALEENYRKTVIDYGATSKKVEKLEEQLNLSKETIQKLRREVRTTGSTSQTYKSRISSLEESLSKSQSAGREKSNEIKNLSSQLENLHSQISKLKSEYSAKLEESKAREQKAISVANGMKKSLEESKRSSQSILKSYVDKQSDEKGIKSSRIMESITPGMTIKDVDNLIDEEVNRTDRYSKLPTTDDRFLGVLSEGKVSISTMKSSEEDSQTKTFMEQVYNMKG